MFKNIALGIYHPGNSLLHRLQARTKLLVLLYLTIYFIIANRRVWHFAPYIVSVLLLLTAISLSAISFYYLWRRMRLLVLLSFLGPLPIVFSPHPTDTLLPTSRPVMLPSSQHPWIMSPF